MFERGIKAHGMYALFDPLIKVPLLIFPPGHKGRVDIHTPTSAVDILPTILDIVNNPGGSWMEGTVLPPFNQNFPEDRPVFSMDSRFSDQNEPFSDASVMIRKGSYKLIYSFGTHAKYKRLNGQPLFELFDVESDPEELINLVEKEPKLFEQLRAELFQAMDEKGQLA
jgi:arylsulfatase A-like enzyme